MWLSKEEIFVIQICRKCMEIKMANTVSGTNSILEMELEM